MTRATKVPASGKDRGISPQSGVNFGKKACDTQTAMEIVKTDAGSNCVPIHSVIPHPTPNSSASSNSTTTAQPVWYHPKRRHSAKRSESNPMKKPQKNWQISACRPPTPLPIAATDFKSPLCDDQSSFRSANRYSADRRSQHLDSSDQNGKLIQQKHVRSIRRFHHSAPSHRPSNKSGELANFSKVASHYRTIEVTIIYLLVHFSPLQKTQTTLKNNYKKTFCVWVVF